MADTPLFAGSRHSEILTLVPNFSTRPRIAFVPGTSGAKIERINISSTDAGANNVQFYIGKKRTLASAMGTGALVDGGGSSDTITRSGGSFVTDGWLAGMQFLVAGATTVANDFKAILTAAAAGTLTFATATVDTAENLPSTAALYELIEAWYVATGAGSGLPSAAAISGMTTTALPMLSANQESGFDLQADQVLIASAVTALTGTERIGIFVDGFDY